MNATNQAFSQQTEQQLDQEKAQALQSLPTFLPKADIVEQKTSYELSMEVPGLSKEDIEIKVDKKKLLVSGKLQPAEGELWYSEYEVGNFERSFTLSDGVDLEKIEAKLEQGILTLTLSKKSESEPQSISIH